ncbi:MAG: hypothetical protein R2939_11475 [Kofleriaceae bacterium]
MSRTLLTATLLASLPGVVACGSREAAPAPQPSPAADGERTLVGIEPAKFSCDSLISDADLAAIVGGSVRAVDSSLPPPDGVAPPCTYVVSLPGVGSAAATTTAWTFDFDCRRDMKARADALFAQYTKSSADNVVAYNQQSDAGVPVPPDARPASGPPAVASEVDVGARGLDHHGQGLLFIDDDAPCYVRVTGPGADARLALARHLARSLTPATAPMTPRIP